MPMSCELRGQRFASAFPLSKSLRLAKLGPVRKVGHTRRVRPGFARNLRFRVAPGRCDPLFQQAVRHTSFL